MSPEERQLLTALFDRIRTAAATPRDRDAETLIDQATREQPYATYYLAQAVIVQEKGLEAAANRIRELEDRIHQLEAETSEHHRAEQSGGFLSSIFGSGQPQQSTPAPRPGIQTGPQSGPWGSAPRQNYRTGSDYDDGYRAPPPSAAPWSGQMSAPSAGGSFLRGALGTAAGVAGGMLLANSLSGIFGSHMNSLGLGSPLAGANPFGSGNAPAEETVVNNNYFGDDAIRQASDGNAPANSNDTADKSGSNDGWQQADYVDDDFSDDQADFDNSDIGSDDSMDV
ncbi:Putative periplasmic ligand-binding sensor protein [Neorhizobium galegae bv. orientalis]|nr:Putative periplasmic ligand-binding sensor protein [Neorhizobium galegae bv. orientalis]